MLSAWEETWEVRRIDASGVIDAVGTERSHPSGVSVFVRRESGRLIVDAIGPTAEVGASSRWRAVECLDRRGAVLIPGLVNAHTHLDLTHIGPRPYEPSKGFGPWIDMVRRERLTDEADIAASVSRGVELSLKGGTVLAGDIAGAVGGKPSASGGRALARDGRLNGVSFLEFFAHGVKVDEKATAAAELAEQLAGEFVGQSTGGRVVSGLQPHAVYSVHPRAYAAAIERVLDDMPICSHVAESEDERLFVVEGRGPLVTLLESLGLLTRDERGQALIARGASPVEAVMDGVASSGRAMTAVHVNLATDDDLYNLAAAGWPVVYCPRASAYFAAERWFGPHRYRAMLEAGIEVALGTDSIINLDTPGRMSVWDEMAYLHGRDGVDPLMLLKMATVNGARAIGRTGEGFSFADGASIGGIVAVESGGEREARAGLAEALRRRSDPELLMIGRV